MGLTYAAKRALIKHLANHDAWRNLHNEPANNTHDQFNKVVYGHAITFEKHAFDIDLPTAIKLVIAYDFVLEPSLKANHKEDDTEILKALFQIDPDNTPPPKTQDIWTDTTDYDGDNVALPANFRIHAEHNKTDLHMSLDGREAIWSQTAILDQALQTTHAAPVQLISFYNMPKRILHILQNGHTARDHREQEWVFSVLHHKHSAAFAKQARIAAHTAFNVKGDAFSAISFDKGIAVLAMLSEVLQHQINHYRPLFPGMV